MISIIIPAHNEGQVIARTLKAIIAGATLDEFDIVAVCNGCSDNTADVARSFGPSVRVVETEIASKTHALNIGDAAASAFPRVYVDADIVLTADAIRQLIHRLERGDVFAVAPTPSVNLTGCSWPVRAFYEIRSLLPSANEGIGGSGVYALSEAGRRRFGNFPALIADDGYVRIQFRLEERETLGSVRSTVFPPKTLRALIATKTRAHQGSFELKDLFPKLWQNRGQSNNRALIRLFRDPRLWLKLVAYCFVTVLARREARKRFRGGTVDWERDDTSRATA